LRYLQPQLQYSYHGRRRACKIPQMRIALAQFAPTLGDVAANRRRAQAAVVDAEAAGAGLVVFPELFLSGYAVGTVAGKTAVPAEAAAEIAVGDATVAVGFHERAEDATYNSVAVATSGRVLHVQRKLFPVAYPPFSEHQQYARGDELRAVDTAGGRLAVLICNDAWQPIFPSLAVLDGAEILVMPAASSTAFEEAEPHWRAITSFFARVLRCYVVFVNRVGSEAGLTFWGGSHIVGPSGEVVAEAPRLEEALVLGEIDVEEVRAQRAQLPLESDPRLDLVHRELGRLSRKQ
jgi:N-carbamoylputrescine amidase